MDKIKGESLVEAGGFEPPTPCLQSRCTTENTGSANLTDRTDAHDGAQPKDAEETQGIKRPWTPGPWVADLKHYPGGADCYVRHHVQLPPDDMSPSIYLSGYDGAEVSANTRLCAAAPELFEALAVLMQDVELFVPARHIPSVEQARAAMDKALGVGE